jgi:hypothetical protein
MHPLPSSPIDTLRGRFTKQHANRLLWRADLDVNGNQRENVDFRGVYCSPLEEWFGQDAAAVIPGARRFARYQLVQ